MRIKILSLTSTCLFFYLDWLSKSWALKTLATQVIDVTSFLQWRLAFNCGAAFSFLANQSGWQKYLFLGIAIVLSAYLLWLILRGGLSGLQSLAYAAVIAGALGNAYDRIAYGCVVDFIHVYYGAYHYPIFNVADIFICCGIALTWLSMFRDKKT